MPVESRTPLLTWSTRTTGRREEPEMDRGELDSVAAERCRGRFHRSRFTSLVIDLRSTGDFRSTVNNNATYGRNARHDGIKCG